MSQTPNQHSRKTPNGKGSERPYLRNEQDRFVLLVNDQLELLYSTELARRYLRLPKIGEKIDVKSIVQAGGEQLVYEGVRAALKDKKVQCYNGLQMAADPEPITADLQCMIYNPSADADQNRVLLEWVPLENFSRLKAQERSSLPVIEKMQKAMRVMESGMKQLQSEVMTLRKENAKLRIFAMSAAHDLRNPLTIWQYCMDLMGQYDCADRRAEACRDGRRAAKRFETLLDLLEELIYNEEIRSGRAEEQDLESVLETVLFLLELDINHRQVSVEFNFSQQPALCFPKAFIAIVLHNLLSNAVKYSDIERMPTIKVSSQMSSGYMVLTVSDNGVGMTEEVKQKYLFQAFARPKQEEEGRGLGLHIVKSILEENGGEVSVQSELGKGSTFTLKFKPYLPAKLKTQFGS